MTGIAAIGYVALRYIAAPIAHQILEKSENIHKHSSLYSKNTQNFTE
jgi:hypothetical protein